MTRLVVFLIFVAAGFGFANWMQMNHAFRPLGSRQRAGEAPVSRYTPTTECWPDQVKGVGTDLDSAEKDALREARDKIMSCIRHQNPPLTSWSPSESYIRKLIWRQKDENLSLTTITAKQVVVYLKSPDWDELYRLDQEQRSEARSLLFMRAFAGFLVFLAGVLGYLRLDEWTRGAYRHRLQIVGTGLVAAAWTGLWLLV